MFKRRFPGDAVCTREQARELTLLSAALNRQIGLLIDRAGKVRMVIAGEYGSVYIPQLPNLAPGPGRLRGWRLLHTHLDGSGLSREDLLDALFLRLDAVFALNVREDGEPGNWQWGWLDADDGDEPFGLSDLKYPGDYACDFLERARAFEKNETADLNEGADRRALLISVSDTPVAAREDSLRELAELVKTAGLTVCDTIIQRVPKPDSRLIMGKGKLAEVEGAALRHRAEILVFDGELTPAQSANLAEATERKILDRSQIILDIFAQRAVSRAGRLQVEMAQLAYAQPRLIGKRPALDRLAGGVGGRGPGETKLETDRRRIRERITRLKRELKELRKQRGRERQTRTRRGTPTAALVGYTNAGKSTLLNVLTRSQTYAADKLFATLDPVARRARFPRAADFIITDTVGFIRDLPKELMEAFRATLEELEAADILVLVADASDAALEERLRSARTILESLELERKPVLQVLNKIDRLSEESVEALRSAYPGAAFVSAQTGAGLENLLTAMERELFMRGVVKAAAEGDEE